nr:RNA-directed DNA polymerase, eukaryota, reverse transcriptase zinc-binding domain protein [Tanacetum cinerariifolium]
MTFIWHVWNWRNKILHAPSNPEADAIRHEDIFPSVQRLSLFGPIIVLLRNSSLERIGSKIPNSFDNHSEMTFLVRHVFRVVFGFRSARLQDFISPAHTTSSIDSYEAHQSPMLTDIKSPYTTNSFIHFVTPSFIEPLNKGSINYTTNSLI